MNRTRNSVMAKGIATEREMYYGMSVFDGWFYVGTLPQLEAIGCVNIRHWSAE